MTEQATISEQQQESLIKSFYKDIPFDAEFFMKAAQRVLTWNAIARNTTIEQMRGLLEDEDAILQTNLVFEELKEYRDAFKDGNMVEMADACADTFVVATMLAYMYLGQEPVYAAQTNRPEAFFSADPYELYLRMREYANTTESFAMMALKLSLTARDSLIRSRFNEKKVVNEVLKSNDSKFPKKKHLLDFHETKDINVALELECIWIEENRGHIGVAATHNKDNKVYVFKNSAGKIMKPSSFVEPDLSKIVK